MLILPLILLVTFMASSKSLSHVSTPSSNNRQPLLGILFDIDGTLVNSDPLHFKVFQDLLLQQDGFNDNKPIDELFFRSHIHGRQNALIMEELFPTWSLQRREEWSIHKEDFFRKAASSQVASLKMPGLDRLRTWIQERKTSFSICCAAVTNAPRLNAEAILNGIGYGIDDDTDNDDGGCFFQTLVIGDECEKAKPDPCPYLTACERLDVSAENCIIFEDSPSGATAGVAAGAFVIGVRSGQEESTLLDVGCKLVIEDFEDSKLWECLEERFYLTDTARS